MTDPEVVGARRGACLGWAAGLTVAFVALAALVAARWTYLVDLDRSLEAAVHGAASHHRAWVIAAVIVSDAGSPVSVNLLVLAVALALLIGRRLGAARRLVVARLMELAVATVVKYLVARPRPMLPDPVGQAGGFSFPSGHAAGTAVLAVALLVLAAPVVSARARSLVIVLVGLVVVAVAASRLVLGVHYLSDVVGGALLGTACALAVGSGRVATHTVLPCSCRWPPHRRDRS